MLNDRVKELLDYLNVLSQVQGAGHYVNDEIKECVKEVRLELGLEQRKQDTLKMSRKLVFEAKLKERGFSKPSFAQYTVFESAFCSVEKEIEMLFFNELDAEVDTAVTVLKDMKAQCFFEFTPYPDIVSLKVTR